MSLMKLAPECVRLRRMAKAHAAGEVTEDEYRQARREVIDGFSSAPYHDDDTRPRFAEDPTLRNEGSVSDAVPSAVGSPQQSLEVHGSRRWLWLGLLALAAAAATALAGLPQARAAEAPAAVSIPPVAARDPDPARSARLSVERIALGWGEEGRAPPARVDMAALQVAADRALAEVRRRHQVAEHGFTQQELAELARFLNVLGVHEAGAELDQTDARDLAALIREQKQRRGISVAELEDVARAVQADLREQGYFLAAAYLPAQDVADGVVRIDMLPGRLGDVAVSGADPGMVSAAFRPLLDEPVTLSEVSSRLETLNAMPGLTAQASFAPGEDVGETRLKVDVLEQRPWSASAALDNHGDSHTGEVRLGARVAWASPRGVGDHLRAGALTSFDPANQSYGWVDYEMPGPGGYRFAARLANNDFTDDGLTTVDGGGLYLDLLARRDVLRRRDRSLTLAFTGARHELDWDDGVDQTVTMAGAGLLAHRVWDGARVAADAAARLSLGHIGGDRFAGQERDFWVLEMDGQAWMPLPGDGRKLVLRLAGQWSDSLLPATRRFALGGASRIRAFDRGEFLADRGVLLSLETRSPLALGELLLFAEAGYGDGLAQGAETWAHVTAAGVGWEASLSRSLSSRMTLALPLSAKGTGGLDDEGARLYWSLRYDH